MLPRTLGSGVFLVLLAGAASARDRLVTDDERARLAAALAAQGCAGGKMEFDDDGYEVDAAKCGDGRSYDLEFDKSFGLLSKKLDD